MLYLALVNMPYLWVGLLLLHSIGYSGILRKMGLNKRFAFIPFVAEKRIGDVLFQTPFAFRHPFIMAALFTVFRLYFNPFGDRVAPVQRVLGIALLVVAFLNYYTYLTRMFWRLGKSFGKGVLFRIGMILIPFPFLCALGLLRMNRFLHGTPIRLSPLRPKKWFRWLLRGISSLSFLGELAVVALSLILMVTRTNLPRTIIEFLQMDMYNSTANITGDGTEVLREENMGEGYANFSAIAPSRAKFYDDNQNAKSVVVLEYVIGSDLESKIGAASTNMKQFIDASKQGENLTFVLEAGGSYRWFTNGIADASVGRYTIQNGKLEKVMEIDSYTSMARPQELADFLQWAKENYPADRYMLVLWDHGGGLSQGYGSDDLNRRKDEDKSTLQVDEIVSIIKDSGMRFDMIGFDACLMQDIEIAYALEPYADYLIASEESEPAGGWFYTTAFGMLAKDPTTPTEDFGRELIGCYDAYNKAMSEGEEVDKYTLSMVDLTYVKPAYEKLEAFFEKQNDAILADESDYVDISAAANAAYTFHNNEQIDLVHYLELLNGADYNQSIANEEEINELIAAVKAPVVVRNRRSAAGINGIALTFPYQMISSYLDDYTQLKALNMNSQEKFSSNFFSIMAASRDLPEGDGGIIDILLSGIDYTEEPWYVSGFENYVTDAPLISIPIVKNEDAYSLELSDRIWNIIVDAKQFYFMKTDTGRMYLGMDDAGRLDEQGHPMITTDGTWISIDGQPIYYEPSGMRETENGTVFTGISKAKLNGDKEVILYIEWEPVKDGEAPEKGTIVGYDPVNLEQAFMRKGTDELEPGETLDFLFDFYDEEGKLIETKTVGRPYLVVKTDSITISNQKLGSCVLEHGIVLTDAYQRKFQSELVETPIE